MDNLRAEYEAKIAQLDAQTTQVLGEAEAESKRLKETAQSTLYQLKLQVFQHDTDAFLRYSLAEKLRPELAFRIFHSGPGTFWTNLENKELSLLLPAREADGQASPQSDSRGSP